jgi:hypothetical protein
VKTVPKVRVIVLKGVERGAGRNKAASVALGAATILILVGIKEVPLLGTVGWVMVTWR